MTINREGLANITPAERTALANDLLAVYSLCVGAVVLDHPVSLTLTADAVRQLATAIEVATKGEVTDLYMQTVSDDGEDGE